MRHGAGNAFVVEGLYQTKQRIKEQSKLKRLQKVEILHHMLEGASNGFVVEGLYQTTQNINTKYQRTIKVQEVEILHYMLEGASNGFVVEGLYQTTQNINQQSKYQKWKFSIICLKARATAFCSVLSPLLRSTSYFFLTHSMAK